MNSESANEIQRKSSKIGLLDELVEIFVEDFELEASVASKDEGAFQPNDVVSEFRVMEDGCLKNLDLNLGLSIEFFLIFDDLQSNMLSLLMVISFENTSE